MRKDPTAFRQRFAAWKNGKLPYKNGIPYDDDNHNIEYDHARAALLGYQPDKAGHYDTRDYETGRYLKSPIHPTLMKGIVSDLGVGYIPYYNPKDGQLYSHTWMKPYKKEEVPTPYRYKDGKLPKFKDGTRYILNYAGGWDRITDGDVAKWMADMVITPLGVRPRFDYENNPNYVAPRQKNEAFAPDNTLWTRQQIEKAKNTRTWLSTAADVSHAVGEGAMIASSFASPEIDLLMLSPALKAAGNFAKRAAGFYDNIPYVSTNFYRGVNKAAIKDALKSGILRGKNFSQPFFGLGREPWNEGYVIEGTPKSSKWIYSNDYNNHVMSGDPIDNFITNNVRSEGIYPIEALPWNGSTTNVPVEGFNYWKKYPLLGWKKKGFSMINPKNAIKRMSTVDKLITEVNASKITPAEWTAAQDAAIARGDMAEAQRLRDLHFKINTPGNVVVKQGTPAHNYHGTDSEFNTFDIGFFGRTDYGDRGKGFYFSENRNVSEDYGPIVKDVYLYAKTPYKGFGKEKYLGRGRSKDEVVQYLTEQHRKGLEDTIKHMINQQKSGSHSPMYDELGITKDMSEQEIRNLVNKAYNHEDVIPYEVGNLDEADVFLSPYENVVFKPNQIKSANAVTYDNNGVRIPLGERDNFKLNDIRYGLFPFISGGIGYRIYNKYAE